jgi:hypothetical protein
MDQNIESTWASNTTARGDREIAECERWRQEIDQDFIRQKTTLAAVLPSGSDWAVAGEPATVGNPSSSFWVSKIHRTGWQKPLNAPHP